MEVIFNLLWLAISALLVGIWLLRSARGTNIVRHSLGVQLIALALLIVILLPVVSLTDDLHATALLTESDRLWRRCDFQTIGDLATHVISIAIAGLALTHVAPQRRTLSWLASPARKSDSFAGYLRILSTRPPPAV
ncbi:MAG TPA: hypothetical protein VGT04_01415 [Acidobacteriaceae bacterium]|nr:hypothetical protein [Acidobacteriaceae bacterium]